MAPSPQGTARRQLRARTSRQDRSFAACGRDAGRRPAAPLPRAWRGGALWWWWGECDEREWRRAGVAARGGHETAFRQPARSAHGSGAPVSDRHRPRSGETSRASFRRMAPSPKGTARRQLPARTSLRRLRFRFPRQGGFRGLRPRCRSETGAPLPRALGAGERCGGGWGVTSVDGGVRVSPARATKPRSDNLPEVRTAVERRSLTGIARAAGETPGLPFAAWRPRQRERCGDSCARVRRFVVFVSGSHDGAGVSRPAAAMPVGDRRSAAARAWRGGALWWWWAECDEREWRRAGVRQLD